MSVHILFFVVFIDTVGFGIILPLQPFFAKQLGASDSVVTLVASSFTAAQLIFAPFWGALSDRIGRRPVMLITIAGTAVGYFWLAFIDSLFLLFVVRAFGGMMAANIGVAHAYVADILPPESRARGMGRLGAAAGLGFVAGPAVGGLLAGSDPLNPAVHIPFLTAAAASALAFMLAIFILREPVRDDNGASRRRSAEPRQNPLARGAPHRGQILLLIGLMFLCPFVFSGAETTLALWSASALGWGAVQNGILYTYMGAAAVVTQGVLVGPIVAWIGERRTVLVGAAAVAIGAVSLPFSGGYAGLLWALGLMVFGISIAGTSLNSLLSVHAPPDQRGRLLGVAQRSAGFGRFVGPASAGAGFEFIGRDTPYFGGAVAMLVLFLLARQIRTRPPDRP